jgi:hypothetical protein
MAVHTRLDGQRRGHTGRHLRTALTLLVLLGFVVWAAWSGWQALTADGEEATVTAAPTCRPAAGVAPEDVQLNVYNATSRSGLAAATAGTLRERGFTILAVSNDPLAKQVPGTAEVRANPQVQAAADLVASQVPEAQFVPDSRAEPTVDLVLGDAFEALGPPPAPAPEGDPAATPDPAATAAAASDASEALPFC